MAYPTNIDNFTHHIDSVDDVMAVDVNELQDAIESLEAKVGADSSAVNTSHDYKLSDVTTGNKAESSANKRTSFQATPDNTSYASEKLVKDSLNLKAPLTAPTFDTSITGSYLTASEVLITDANKKIVSAPVATYPSLPELSYVKGVTSGIQSQLNGKQATGSYEVTTNKETSALDTSTTKYPCNNVVKSAVDAKLALAGGTMTGDIQLGETDIKLDATLSADEKWSGITVAGTAGATLAVGDVCYLATSGKWLLNDGILDGTDTGFDKQLGVCVLASTDTNPTEMLLYGKIRSAAFPVFTVGSPVYLSDTAGDIQVAQPSTTNFAIRKVGIALSAEELMFNPSNDYIVHI